MTRFIVWLGVVQVLSAGPMYRITDIGAFGGNDTFAIALNDNRMVTGYYSVGGTNRAFVWSNGVIYDPGTLGGNYSYPNDINASGQIAGQSYDAMGNTYASVTTGTNTVGLGTLGGRQSYGYGINDAGDVVGSSDTTGGNLHAFYWSQATGTMRDLNAPGGLSIASDVNNHGQVTGIFTISPGGGARQMFFYDGTQMITPGTLGGAESVGTRVNDAGQVAGYSQITGGAFHAFLYSNGVMTDIHNAGYAQSFAYGLNNAGSVVGVWRDAGNNKHAFLWTMATGMLDLQALIDPTLGWYLLSAAQINNNGDIVGYGILNGQVHAFLLTEVPEAGTLGMMAVGLVLVMTMGRRRITPTVSRAGL